MKYNINMRTLKIGLLQQHNVADRTDNMMRLAKGIEDMAKRGAQLIVLQELHNSLYFCQVEDVNNFDLAEPIPGPSTGFYGELAKQFGVVIVTSLFEKRAPGLYHNTAVVIEKDGSIAGKYRKMHIPDDPAYYEKFYFTPGDLGFHPIQTSVGKLGVLVCWDQWYPEAARLMALQGAELLIYPTAIGYADEDTPDEQQRQREAWTTVMRGHAVANGLPVIAVNRVGFEPDPSEQTPGINFWGSSFVAGPQGELFYRASEKEEESLVVELNLERSENVRRWWPFLRDRRSLLFVTFSELRVNLYKIGNNKRYQAQAHHDDEECAVAHGILQPSRNHSGKHQSQIADTRADGIMGGLEFALRNEEHVEREGRKTESVTELFHKDTDTDENQIGRHRKTQIDIDNVGKRNGTDEGPQPFLKSVSTGKHSTQNTAEHQSDDSHRSIGKTEFLRRKPKSTRAARTHQESGAHLAKHGFREAI